MDVLGVNAYDDKSKMLAITGKQRVADEAVSIGNAFLIAEAGTVYNENRIRPRQMLELMLAAQSRNLDLEAKVTLASKSNGFNVGHPPDGVEEVWLLIRSDGEGGEEHDTAVLAVLDGGDWYEAGDWKADIVQTVGDGGWH